MGKGVPPKKRKALKVSPLEVQPELKAALREALAALSLSTFELARMFKLPKEQVRSWRKAKRVISPKEASYINALANFAKSIPQAEKGRLHGKSHLTYFYSAKLPSEADLPEVEVGMPLTRIALRALLALEESATHERKSLWTWVGVGERGTNNHFAQMRRQPLPDERVRALVAEVIAAFANSQGGTLLLGVNDDKGVSGHGYGEKLLRLVREALSWCEPQPKVSARWGLRRSRSVLALEVEPCANQVLVCGQLIAKREGASIRRTARWHVLAEENFRAFALSQEVAPETNVPD